MKFFSISDVHFNLPSSATLKRYCFALAALAAVCSNAAAADVDFSPAQREPTPIVRDWGKMIYERGNEMPEEKLRRVNEFINRSIQFSDDQSVWGHSDYWASPMETMTKGKGDCEDFAIAKYFTLIDMGIPEDQLRIIYVRSQLGGSSSGIQQAHMVVGYYPTPSSEPLILDNLITEIRSAQRRPDLVPVFSFNSHGVYAGISGEGRSYGGPERLKAWQSVLDRTNVQEPIKLASKSPRQSM